LKKIDNIEQFDDLLKQQFDSFAPEPPAEVWQSLSQHPAMGNASATSKFVSAVKSMSVASKAIMFSLFVTSIGASVVILSEDKIVQVSNSSNVQAPALKDNPSIVDEPYIVDERPIIPPNSDLIFERKHQLSKPIAEKSIMFENGIAQKSSNIENEELKAELRSSVNETPQLPTLVEKVIVKTPIVENVTIIEPELITQTSTLADVDTLIAPEIPNTFTPGDDDNLNKEFVIKIENESTYRLRIFDSKANMVFESCKKEIRWNGQHFKSGENCESGKYFYMFDYQYKGIEKLRQKSGFILLTR
jgi:gliding motility-associated-like protein